METIKRFCMHPAVLVLSGCLLVAGLIALGLRFELSKSDWASWVQAVGSMVAIAVALHLSDQSFRKAVALDRDKQLSAEFSRLRHINSLVALAYREALDLSNAVETDHDIFMFDYDWEVLADTRLALDGLPKFEIPDSEVLFGIVRLCRHLKIVEGTMQRGDKFRHHGSARYLAQLHALGILEHTRNLKSYAQLAQQKVVAAMQGRST